MMNMQISSMSWRQTIWSVNIFLIAPFKSSNFLFASASLLPLFFLQKMTGEMFAGVNLTGATGTLAVSSFVELKVGLRKEVSTWSYMLGKNDMLGKVMHWIIFIVTFHHSIYFRNLSRSFRIEK